MNYDYTKKVKAMSADAVRKVKKKLAIRGFGVLSKIVVQATLKKKLNVDFDKYLILGTSYPPFVYNTLPAETKIGLLLPCNGRILSIKKKSLSFCNASLSCKDPY
jgi:uncharacterized protein (DUF302 family)